MNVGSDVETRQTSNPWIVNNSRTMLDKDCHYEEFSFFLLKLLFLFLELKTDQKLIKMVRNFHRLIFREPLH